MNKIQDWVDRLKKGHMLSVIGVFLLIIIILGILLYQKQVQARQVSENTYNMAFYELVDYVENVETYLAKSLISTTPQHGAETLTSLWREANMAQTYLSRLPIESQELEKTQKFLNQVSDYSYSLSRKNIYDESLGEEDLKNLKDLHDYSLELESILNQLSEDINSGRIKWGELTKKGNAAFAQQVSTESKDGFSNLEENFHEYSGLIYDGAFSEHLTNEEKKGMKFFMNKIQDWMNRLKKGHMLSVIGVFLLIIIILGILLYQRQVQAKQVSENTYNMAFYELVDYVENVETYLAKSLISTTPQHGAETLTSLWREANMAQTYLARLPIESQELEKTQKFLNQVSDYSYSLSRKNIYDESLGEEDLKNLKELHDYSIELENILNQLSEDINSGRIKWGELSKKGNVAFAQQVSTESKDGFNNLEENFHEYSGLIYDGAFSEHLTNEEKKGLTGEIVDEEKAKQVVTQLINQDKIKEISSLGLSENATIPSYTFSVQTSDNKSVSVSISQKGGHVIYMNYDREVTSEIIQQEEANKIGKEFLAKHGFENMKETYYLKQDGIVTINYAYNQDGVVMYPDLVKVKVALDNGEILGIETTGFLNNHTIRDLSKIKISKEEAKKTLNKQLNIESEGLAYIPTEWRTEILCYEFKGNVEGKEFLVYINAENGREEDILVIKDTPNGTLTM